MVVALGTRQGATWGIYLQLERLNLPRQTLDKETYPMPEFIG